jgi:putative aldouronate transport system substrate-binding protein
MGRRVILVSVALLLALNGCGRSGSFVAGRLRPRQSIDYVVTGILSDKGEPFVQSLLDVVAERTGVRVNLRVFPSWTRPDSTGKTTDVLEQIPTPDIVVETQPHLQERLQRGYYAALGEVLPRLCPNVWRSVPPETWEANRVEGAIYGIPLDARRDRGYWVIRADIRNRFGLEEIGSYAELLDAARVVAEDRSVPKPILGDIRRPLAEIRCRYDVDMRKTASIDSLLLYYQGNDGSVHNLLDEIPDNVRRVFDSVRDLGRAGLYVAPRVGAPTRGILDYLRDGDWFAAYVPETEVQLPMPPGPPIYSWVQQIVIGSAPGARMEVLFEGLSRSRPLVDLRSSSFLCVPAASRRRDLALRLLNDLGTREMYDLLHFGIEASHWKPVVLDAYEELGGYGTGAQGVGYRATGMEKPSMTTIRVWSDGPFTLVAPLSSNPAFLRVPTGIPAAYRERYLREMRRQDGSEPDLLTGFVFDSRPVWEQVYDYVAKYHAAYLRLAVGEVPFEPAWAWLRREAYEPVKAIQRELERQISAFLSRRR